MSKICYCGRLFINSLSLVVVLKFDPIVVIVLDKNIINIAFFDYCDQKIDEYQFYYSYFNILKQKKIPKFFSINKINVIIC